MPSSKGQGEWPTIRVTGNEAARQKLPDEPMPPDLRVFETYLPASSIQGLVEALGFYADRGSYFYDREAGPPALIAKDRGDRARTALSHYKAVSNGG